MNDNYYIVLELSPDVTDWPTIEGTIESARRKWSHQKVSGNPTQQREAGKWLNQIPTIKAELQDEDSRRKMAGEARRLLAQQDQALHSTLDEFVALLSSRAVDASHLKKWKSHLKKSLNKEVSEDDIRRYLQGRGIQIVSTPQGDAKSPGRPTLEASIAKEIQEQLTELHHDNLYDFLGMGEQSSTDRLRLRAEAINREIQQKGLTDPVSTMRKGLAGHAQNIFKTDESRARYDATYSLSGMDKFESKLEILALDRNEVLTAEALEPILAAAKAKGIQRDLALEYIEGRAKKRKWKLLLSANSNAQRLRVCGSCRAVAKTPTDARCHNCGRALILPCPQCQTPTPTEDQACSNCGFSTGDRPIVDGLIREAQEHQAAGRFADAKATLATAKGMWPMYSAIHDAEQALTKVAAEQTAATERIEQLVRQNRLEAASTAVDRARRELGVAIAPLVERKIDDGLARARRMAAEAEALRQRGDNEGAIQKFSDLLRICADFTPAVRALAAIPPPSPSAAYASVDGENVSLQWRAPASKSPLAYRIIRKAHGAPSSEKDGSALAEVNDTRYDDTNVPPGTPWFYAIYSVRGPALSTVAATTGPHLRAADVTELTARGENHRVALQWKAPPNCVSVVVARAEGRVPSSRREGRNVPVSGHSAVDDGLINGRPYGYRVIAQYRDPKTPSGLVDAPGAGILATPVEPPAAVTDLSARLDQGVVLLGWTPPNRGRVQIRVAAKDPGLRSGHIMSVGESAIAGQPVPESGPGHAQLPMRQSGRLFFTPLTVVNETVSVGTSTVITSIENVAKLDSQRQGNTIHLTWRWPPGVQQVLVAWRYDRTPLGPDDPESQARKVRLPEYQSKGMWSLEKAAQKPHYFAVYARDGDAEIYSSGVNRVEASGSEAVVKYRVGFKRGFFGRKPTQAWLELSCPELDRLPPVKAVLKPNLPPVRDTDGKVIATAGGVQFSGGAARIDLPVADIGFVKLFFEDSAQARVIRLLPASKDQLKLG